MFKKSQEIPIRNHNDLNLLIWSDARILAEQFAVNALVSTSPDDEQDPKRIEAKRVLIRNGHDKNEVSEILKERIMAINLL